MLRALLGLFWNICLLKKGPQDLPAASILLFLLFFLYILSAIVEGLIVGLLWPNIQEALIVFALETLIIYGMLSLKGLSARFVQTISAFLGTGLVLTLIILPILSLFKLGILDAYVYSNILLILIIWRVVISAHIFKNALAISMGLGVVLSLGFFILSLGIHLAMLPEST